MSARTRQPSKQKATAKTHNRERDRDPEIKIPNPRDRGPAYELDVYIRNIISRNDMDLYPPARLRTLPIVDEWWDVYISGRTSVWERDVNEFCSKAKTCVTEIRLIEFSGPHRDEHQFDYFIDNKRVGVVTICNDAHKPIVIEINA
jgi:hypothetical protein